MINSIKKTFKLKYSFKTLHSYTTTATKSVTFSGIQPTGVPHLGNYFGALANWVKLQPKNDDDVVLYSIVDLHALTKNTLINSKELDKNILDITAIILAIGINPDKTILFRQSKVKEHTQLAWILSCNTSFGSLNRMTQWKSKRDLLTQSTNPGGDLGLFTYPVLQAADILLYRATQVPVGEDQRQHLELTRDLAERFNSTFKTKLLSIPKDLYTPAGKIQSLSTPSTKMSKSNGTDKSRILLTDSPTLISTKISKAQTDNYPTLTYDPINRPGISNLITILSQCTNESPQEIINRLGENCNNSQLKNEVTERLLEKLDPIRIEYEKLRLDELYLKNVLQEGANKARVLAKATMDKVEKVVGL